MAEENVNATETAGRPNARAVTEFHTNSDVDSHDQAQHHTLGVGVNQAAPGSHTHDGVNSPALLEGMTLSGSRGSSGAMLSIITALVQLGATDETSA